MRSPLQVSERLYAALLYLYPKKFRTVYGEQMRLTFLDASRVAYRQNSMVGLLALWFPTLLDLFKSALEERARQGEITMSKERFIALAGPLTIAVGALILGGPLGDMVGLASLSEALWEFFHFSLLYVTFTVMLPAFIATWLRYQETSSSLGRLGLILNVAGSGTFCLALLANFLLDALGLLKHPTGPNYMMVAGIVSIPIGHLLFGIDALRYKLLPRWNAIPLLVGLFILLLFVSELFFESNSPEYIVFGLTIASLQSVTIGLCWVLMGNAMMSSTQEHEPAPAT